VGDFQPNWSPDGTKIVFVKGELDVNDIFVMNADGSEQQKIIEGFFSSPVWSPDGTKFALTCEDNISEDVCVVNADGSELKRLTQAQTLEFNYDPAWSPDGTKILFVRDAGLCGIFDFGPCSDTLSVLNADGSNRQQLLALPTSGLSWWRPGWGRSG
jgi:Tol biopolymer transport system component